MSPRPVPLALTMGEPAGIGPEITLKSYEQADRSTPFFVIADLDLLESSAKALKSSVAIQTIDTPAQAIEVFERALPVLPLKLAAQATPGVLDVKNGSAVLSSIKQAVSLVQTGQASAVVTNPIHKAVLYQAGFEHPGHTEFLADLAGTDLPTVMMLVSPQLRVVPITLHVALKSAIDQLTSEVIEHACTVTHKALQDWFGISNPRLVVSGLNPHAGEGGTMGREEIELIDPCLDRLRTQGFEIRGPLSADTMFHAKARSQYDAALCMTHDQALIPIKTLAFDQGVNLTLGLPFVRTSPDHGTALDIAGQGLADPSSLIAALDTAAKLVQRSSGTEI